MGLQDILASEHSRCGLSLPRARLLLVLGRAQFLLVVRRIRILLILHHAVLLLPRQSRTVCGPERNTHRAVTVDDRASLFCD